MMSYEAARGSSERIPVKPIESRIMPVVNFVTGLVYALIASFGVTVGAILEAPGYMLGGVIGGLLFIVFLKYGLILTIYDEVGSRWGR